MGVNIHLIIKFFLFCNFGCFLLSLHGLAKMKIYLSQEHRIQFYKSYIQPHIDFCNIIWGSTTESNKQKIVRMQKRAVRVILDYNVENSHEAMKSLNIQSIYDRLFLIPLFHTGHESPELPRIDFLLIRADS